MTACLSETEIEAFLAGSLSEVDRSRLEGHLASCTSCRDAVARQREEAQLFGAIKDAFQGETLSGCLSTVDVPHPAGEPSALSQPPAAIEGYDILAELHRGGQGVVYKAVQKATKRTVALKVLLFGAHASARQRFRFEREIDLVASLHHPNIVTVYDSGVTSDGLHYFAMEYIHGLPLDAHLAQRQLRLKEVLGLFGKICSAVSHAHQHGVIHRDLKPANIRVDAEGNPHILDFGLAKVAVPGLVYNGGPVTVTGDFMGTLAYASPEQATGNAAQVDVRSDVYSLGVILYEMLTQHYPYPVVGQMADVLRNIAEADPEPPSTWHKRPGFDTGGHRTSVHRITDELETIVLKALAKEKERRYQSADALFTDIEHYLNDEPIDAKRDSAWYVVRKLARRHIYATTAVACLLLTIISFGVISLDLYHQTQRTLEAKAGSDALLNERTAQLADVAGGMHSAVRQAALGWFLHEWWNDRLEQARQIRDQMRQDSPEYQAADFLLNDTDQAEEFISGLERDARFLGYFVIGERYLKNGRTTLALSAFEESMQHPASAWLRDRVQARLKQLRAMEIAASPPGG